MVSTPKSPDPYAVAQAQGNQNFQTAYTNSVMGNVNEQNPYGSVKYSVAGQEPIYNAQGQVTGYAPRWNKTVSLSPEQQELYKLSTAAQKNLGQLAVSQSGRLQGVLGQSLNTEGLPEWQAYNKAAPVRRDEAPTDRQAIENAMMSRYNTDAARQNAAQDAQLAARGLSPGSEQYGQVYDAQNRARTDALNQAYLASGQESRQAQDAYNRAVAQEFEMGNTWTSAENARRGQMFQERQTLRNAPINEISALLSGSQVTVPQFQAYNAPQMSTVPIGQYIYDDYNARAQQSAAQNQGIFGLLGGVGRLALGGMSGGAGWFA